MESKREQALVGLFVIIASAILIATILTITGTFRELGSTYSSTFAFAGGIEAGAPVRYAGGPRVGRVERVVIDEKDPTRIRVYFSVQPGTPIKTDSKVKISSLSALGDNYIEVSPGSPGKPRAPVGSELKSEDYTSFSDLATRIGELSPIAKDLLTNLNERAKQLNVTIERVNDLLNDRNRENLGATIANARGMLEEDRPKIRTTLTHVEDASAKLPALIDDFKKSLKQADDAIAHLDATIQEDRPELHRALVDLHTALQSAQALVEHLDATTLSNQENIDEIFENVRQITENLRVFTETIKTRPYTLIRSASPPAREPGQKPKK